MFFKNSRKSTSILILVIHITILVQVIIRIEGQFKLYNYKDIIYLLVHRNIKLIDQITYSLNDLNQSSILFSQLLIFNSQNIISLIESNINLVPSFKVERIVILIIDILYYYLHKINSILYIRSYLRKVLQQSILYREAKIQSKAKIYFVQSITSRSL